MVRRWGRIGAVAAVAGGYVGTEYRAYLDLRADSAVEAHLPDPEDARSTQVRKSHVVRFWARQPGCACPKTSFACPRWCASRGC
jgi:hypothetical protein